jgi:hypothetical protein
MLVQISTLVIGNGTGIFKARKVVDEATGRAFPSVVG